MNTEAFLSSKSMVTPGVAGGLALTIATTFAGQFGLPANWTTLAFSFLIGTIVFGDKKTRLAQRLAFYVINSLIIFTVAVGANTTGGALSGQTARDEAIRAAQAKKQALSEVQDEFNRQATETSEQLKTIEDAVQQSRNTQLKARVARSVTQVKATTENRRQALQRAAAEAAVPTRPAPIHPFRPLFR